MPRCREVGFIQRLYIISTTVRSGLPVGSSSSLLLYIISTVVRSVLPDGLLLLNIISTAVRSDLPDGVLLLLLPRHLSTLRVVKWVSHGL